MNKELKYLKQYMSNNLDISKPTIMIQSLYITYRTAIEYLTDELIQSDKYNIIFIYGESNGSKIEQYEFSFCIYPEYLVNNKVYRNNLVFNNIDLVILDDCHGDNFIDTKWLNITAPRLSLSHNIFNGNIGKNIQYTFLPSLLAVKNINKILKNFTKTTIIKGGYPKLDISIKRYKKYKKNIKESSILYAPTLKDLDGFSSNEYYQAHLSNYNYSVGFDYHILKILLDNFDENIIFRPHPFHMKRDHKYIQLIKEKFKNEPRLIISQENYLYDYARSKFMISDLSQTPYTFALTTLKPVVIFAPSSIKRGIITNKIISKVGYRVKTLSALIDRANYILKNKYIFKAQIKNYRKNTVYNIGSSVEYLINYIDKYILKG